MQYVFPHVHMNQVLECLHNDPLAGHLSFKRIHARIHQRVIKGTHILADSKELIQGLRPDMPDYCNSRG